MTFGYGTGEFEVTSERLGCYRPEEHIDNPKDYAENQDARQYHRALRGPVDEERELAIDERTGLKAYIASEDFGITTSAGLVRNLFGRAIDLGRRYDQTRDKADKYEALRLLGTACHCLEDYSAHSNYTELALIELGESVVFPHVGRDTEMRIPGVRHRVYPIVTGTFGGVDFLHSVCGEVGDKAMAFEIEELEQTISKSSNQDSSKVKELLDKLPPGLFGDSDQAGKADALEAESQAAQMENLTITPKEPEAFLEQVEEITKHIYPIMEFHDNLMKNISKTIDKIPVLPDLIEEVQNQVTVFVFSLLAPYVLPIVNQVKTELSTGSSEIIQSSKDHQLAVFSDDDDTNPTHSMLSKDHFSNVLNEPAGKIATEILKWAVPQIVAAWDDDDISIPRTLDRIINGVFHHPATREYGDDGASGGRQAMFGVVEQWWSDLDGDAQDELREKLSREGVEHGRNHKEGVHDHGHGSGKPIGAHAKASGGGSDAGPAAMIGGLSSFLGGGGKEDRPSHHQKESGHEDQIPSGVSEAVGGGLLGSVAGGLAGSLLGGAFSSKKEADTKTYESSSYHEDGSYSTNVVEAGHRPSGGRYEERYGQAELTETAYPDGGHREEFSRYEQDGHSGRTAYGYQQATESHPTYGGGYEQRTEHRIERPGGDWQSEIQEQRVDEYGRHYGHSERHHGHGGEEDRRYGGRDDNHPSEGRHYGEGAGYVESAGVYGEHPSGNGERSSGYGEHSSGYGRHESNYEQSSHSSGYGRVTSSYGQQPGHGDSGYGQQAPSYGGGDYGSSGGYGRHDEQMPGGFDEEEQVSPPRTYWEYGSSGYGQGGSGYGSGRGYGYGGDGYEHRY